MTVSLARRLVWEGVAAPEDVNAALQVHVNGRASFLGALVQRQPEMLGRLEAELGASRGAHHSPVVADALLMRALPPGLSVALLAVPVGRDPHTGRVLVVVADATDPHTATEIAHHLGAPVDVVVAPLGRVLAALGPRDPQASTPPPGPKAAARPSSAIRANTLKPIAAPQEPRKSEPPIPLVRPYAAGVQAPSTVKGVAPQASGPGYAPQVVVSPGAHAPMAAEPIIQLTRTKSLAPPSVSDSSESTGPVTSVGLQAPPTRTLAGPEPTTTTAPWGADGPPLERALETLQQAASAEDVVSALVRGLSGPGGTVLVLAARGKVFEGRDASERAAREAIRGLVISTDRPSVLLTAVQTGHYLGPIPQTLVHAELARILGGSSDEIAVGVVTVSGRAALVYVVSGSETPYLATRRGDRLAEAASRALERIVRDRKKP
jgi:hypothetical protein